MKQISEMNARFKNKRTIIVGPAACLLEDCKDIDIDSFDTVCRLNKHHRMRFQHPEVGSRLDVLFHALEGFQYDKKEVDYWNDNDFDLVARDGNRAKLNRVKNLGYTRRIYTIPSKILIKCKRDFGCNPSTGVMAIFHALMYEAAEVHAIGFDFYQTLYQTKKQNTLLKKIQDNKVGNHHPRKQLIGFKKVIKTVPNFYPHGKLKELLK